MGNKIQNIQKDFEITLRLTVKVDTATYWKGLKLSEKDVMEYVDDLEPVLKQKLLHTIQSYCSTVDDDVIIYHLDINESKSQIRNDKIDKILDSK